MIPGDNRSLTLLKAKRSDIPTLSFPRSENIVAIYIWKLDLPTLDFELEAKDTKSCLC